MLALAEDSHVGELAYFSDVAELAIAVRRGFTGCHACVFAAGGGLLPTGLTDESAKLFTRRHSAGVLTGGQVDGSFSILAGGDLVFAPWP